MKAVQTEASCYPPEAGVISMRGRSQLERGATNLHKGGGQKDKMHKLYMVPNSPVARAFGTRYDLSGLADGGKRTEGRVDGEPDRQHDPRACRLFTQT